MIDETVVEKVISFEKRGIHQALKEFTEVEISGFGKLFISPVKLHKRIKKQLYIIECLEAKAARGEDVTRGMEIATRDLEFYQKKLGDYENRCTGNIRGSKEYPLSSERVEGIDRSNSGAEEGDM